MTYIYKYIIEQYDPIDIPRMTKIDLIRDDSKCLDTKYDEV